jgi:Arsenical resistance operon protein ArsD
MTKLAVYDPAMCCSTGVCGPSVDPALPRFAADLDWLKRQGVEVERYNLAQAPGAFASNLVVVGALQGYGERCLPLVLVDGRVASHGRYPDRAELARFAGLEAPAEGTPATEDSASCRTTSKLVTIGDGPSDTSGGCC